METNHEKSKIQHSVFGLYIHLVAFSLFLYADFSVFFYPVEIVVFRIITLVLCIISLFIYYSKRFSLKAFEVSFSVNMTFIILFTSFMFYILKIKDSELQSRFAQVYSIVMIGNLLFAGVARKYFSKLLFINLVVLSAVMLVCDGYSINEFFKNFNLVFLTVMIIVFNEFYSKTRLEQVNTLILLEKKNEELKNEILMRKKLEKKLEQNANFDPLTGFYSRREGLRLMNEMFENGDFTMAYLDLDNLKFVNDNLGHKHGDDYITHLKESILCNTRDSDILARLGGDEFVVSFNNEDESTATIIMERIFTDLSLKSFEEMTNFDLSFSWGIVECCKERHTSIEILIEEADKKMYEQKLKNRKKNPINSL